LFVERFEVVYDFGFETKDVVIDHFYVGFIFQVRIISSFVNGY